MLSKMPILDKSHSKLGQKLYMVLTLLDIPLNVMIYFYANGWIFGLKSPEIDIALCSICGILFVSALMFISAVCLMKEIRVKN